MVPDDSTSNLERVLLPSSGTEDDREEFDVRQGLGACVEHLLARDESAGGISETARFDDNVCFLVFGHEHLLFHGRNEAVSSAETASCGCSHPSKGVQGVKIRAGRGFPGTRPTQS